MRLSERAEKWLSQEYGLMEGMKRASANPYCPVQSPTGCINLGVAENELQSTMLTDKIKVACQSIALGNADIRYNDFTGLSSFRQSLADFLNENLSIPHGMHIKPTEITIQNGCGSAIEALFHVICDTGDIVIIPSPYYGGFDMDVERRAGVSIVPAQCHISNNYMLDRQILDTAMIKAQKLAVETGRKVRALLAMNPTNPLGEVYSVETVQMMLQFCSENGIHLVMDEIYAFSIFDTVANQSFKSILSTSAAHYDPQSVHFLWGFSKDFCLNGFRVGVVVSRNERVIAGLKELSYFTGVPTVLQRILESILRDREWCNRYFEENRTNLNKNYKIVCDRFAQMKESLFKSTGKQISWCPSSAGFFIHLNFSQFLSASTAIDVDEAKRREKRLFLKFIEGGVYIAPGNLAFHDTTPGTFRLIFAANKSTLNIALDRIQTTLESLSTDPFFQ